MWLHRFDVISQSIMSGHNSMLYKYYWNLCRHMYLKFVMLWLHIVHPLTNLHETKWPPHVKRESDVAQSYISSGYICLLRTYYSVCCGPVVGQP